MSSRLLDHVPDRMLDPPEDRSIPGLHSKRTEYDPDLDDPIEVAPPIAKEEE